MKKNQDATKKDSAPNLMSLLPDWGKAQVRPARLVAQLTRKTLAKRAGIAEATIRNIETGKTQPSPSTALALAQALRLPTPWTESPLDRCDDATLEAAASLLAEQLRCVLLARAERRRSAIEATVNKRRLGDETRTAAPVLQQKRVHDAGRK